MWEMKTYHQTKKIILFFNILLVLNLMSSCGFGSPIIKNKTQVNGHYSYIDNSNTDSNSNVKNPDNSSIADESPKVDPINRASAETESEGVEFYESSQSGTDTDHDAGESGDRVDKVDTTANQTGIVNAETGIIAEDKEPESSEDSVAEIIVKSDNILSNQEKEKLLKEIESEIDSLFDEIDNISDDTEIEEQMND